MLLEAKNNSEGGGEIEKMAMGKKMKKKEKKGRGKKGKKRKRGKEEKKKKRKGGKKEERGKNLPQKVSVQVK